ncbi:MAG: hypothetical protein OXK17_07460 [Thaumarchaeota archaeon]|nr:hypothetical protein [Nitrososphaerota archaeon]
MPDHSDNGPVHKTMDEYGDSFTAHLLEQYKLYVQSAENVSSRRIAATRYLLTLSAALLSLSGLQSSVLSQSDWTLAVPGTGILVSVLWYLIIKSYRDLNTVKFKVIHKLEQHLPAALFRHEWTIANQGRGKSYTAVTNIEKWLPCLFIGAHSLVVAIWVFNKLVELVT